MSRGISGGQKKRVTIGETIYPLLQTKTFNLYLHSSKFCSKFLKYAGEMLVGPAKAFFMDEITTGLDSSTAYQVVNSIREYTHILKGTVLMSLLQPEPETYELFDDVMLLSEGQIVYHGPRDHVLEFFGSLGFKCPERKGVADFLQEVGKPFMIWEGHR